MIDIHSKMTSLDVLLITSDHEGLPMALLEAMTLETPVISHAVGGIPGHSRQWCLWQFGYAIEPKILR